MKKYTEEDLREAFRAGIVRGEFLERDEYAPFHTPLDEDDYITNIFGEKRTEENKIPFTYSYLQIKLDWEKFCDLTGIDYYAKANGYQIEDTEIFYVTETKARKFNLL